jgi:hypothetical protein
MFCMGGKRVRVDDRGRIGVLRSSHRDVSESVKQSSCTILFEAGSRVRDEIPVDSCKCFLDLDLPRCRPGETESHNSACMLILFEGMRVREEERWS